MTRVVGIVACSKTKAAHAAPAVELYQGRTFRAAVEYLRGRGVARIVILSALHGAVDESQQLEPYELALYAMPAESRRQWAAKARAQLADIVGDAHALAIVPAAYAPALEHLASFERLFAGLEQGRLYSALASAVDVQRVARGEEPRRHQDGNALARIIAKHARKGTT